jgi:hypothetical protein
MSQRILGGAMLGLLLTGVGAQPGPASFLRSIEITRPAPAELTLIASPPYQRLLLAEPALVCEPPPRTLLRAGCPAAPPDVLPCAGEGQECRYPTAAGCVAQYECLYGLWSPGSVVCPDGEQGELLAGSGTCEPNTPVADSPCTDEGASCGHQPCGIGGLHQVVAECRCGRWSPRWQGCPLTR